MEARDLRRVTFEEYLALDRAGDGRWEYVDGSAWLMAGASPEHNLVVRNVMVGLTSKLRGRDCRAMPDGQKISTPTTRAHHYPDASVVCGPAELDPDDEHAIMNPRLVVEVLSPTTADYDRGGKLVHYRTIASFEEYVVIDPEARRVEHQRRLDTGQWLFTAIVGRDVELESIGVTLAWDELWTDLDWLAESRERQRA